ncbi:MAG: glycosyltransferase family 2 protein [Candidatus Pacebacteria bacterium]|nr:glycosyltransferase family 2 protein [Candidatus Paceibacterota bacterium]
MDKKVYIIVLNWNGKEDTLDCLQSLRSTDYGNYKVTLVDNGSEDDSVVAVKEQFPEVEVVETGKNLGFAGGNNVGIEYAIKAGADYVFLINNDTTVHPDYLKELVLVAESDAKIGAVGSKIYYHGEPERIWFAGGTINWLKNKGEHIGLDEIDTGQFDEIREVGYLTGCALLVKREVVEKVGVLEDDYFLYYEDADYSLRIQNAGYKTVYAPKSKIYHKVSRSTKPGSASYVYYHVRNGLVNARRNGNLFVKIAIYIFAILLSFKQLVKIIFFPKKRDWAFAVLRGEKDFLRGKMGKA